MCVCMSTLTLSLWQGRCRTRLTLTRRERDQNLQSILIKSGHNDKQYLSLAYIPSEHFNFGASRTLPTVFVKTFFGISFSSANISQGKVCRGHTTDTDFYNTYFVVIFLPPPECGCGLTRTRLLLVLLNTTTKSLVSLS